MSNGWPGFAVLAAGTGQTRKRAADNPAFRWINIVLGNLRTSPHGTFHAIASRYVPRDLAQAQYRFNRRPSLEQILPHLANAAIQTAPAPCRTLV